MVHGMLYCALHALLHVLRFQMYYGIWMEEARSVAAAKKAFGTGALSLKSYLFRYNAT